MIRKPQLEEDKVHEGCWAIRKKSLRRFCLDAFFCFLNDLNTFASFSIFVVTGLTVYDNARCLDVMAMNDNLQVLVFQKNLTVAIFIMVREELDYIYMQVCTMSYLIRLRSSTVPLWDPQILIQAFFFSVGKCHETFPISSRNTQIL